jgi:hypothetical protein
MIESEDKAVYFLFLADDSDRKLGQLRIFVPPDANGTETIDEISDAVNGACLLIRKKHLHCPRFGYDNSGISALKNDSTKNWEKIHGVVVDMRLNQSEHISLREEMWPDLGEKAPSLFRRSKLRMLVCLLPVDAQIPADVQDVQNRQHCVFRFEVVRNSGELEARISGWMGDIATLRTDASLGCKESLVKAIQEFYQRLR